MVAAINTNTLDAHLDIRGAKFDYKHMLDSTYYTSLLFCKAQELDSAFQATVKEALQSVRRIEHRAGEVKSIERMQENVNELKAGSHIEQLNSNHMHID